MPTNVELARQYLPDAPADKLVDSVKHLEEEIGLVIFEKRKLLIPPQGRTTNFKFLHGR